MSRSTPHRSDRLPLLARGAVLLWFGAALGVLLTNSPSVLGAVGPLVVIAAMVGVPDAARRRRERSAALGAAPGAAVVAVAPVDLAVMRLTRWTQTSDRPPPAPGRRALLVADAEGPVLRRAVHGGQGGTAS